MKEKRNKTGHQGWQEGAGEAATAIRLCDLRPGRRGIVHSLGNTGAMRRRLLDLGLVPGTTVECVGRSPGGDPAAYCIRGAVIAIRDRDARLITVHSEEE